MWYTAHPMSRLEAGQAQRNWRQRSAQVAGFRPPLDSPVTDVVVALNLFGIETFSACGGHRDRRPLQGPFISYLEGNVSASGYTGDRDIHFLQTNVLKPSEGNGSSDRVKSYLAEFYATRRVPSRSGLVLASDENGGVIFNQGNRERILPLEGEIDYIDYSYFGYSGPRRRIGRIDLFLYRRQMQQFGSFLKEQYFNS